MTEVLPHRVLLFGPESPATGALSGQLSRLGCEPRPLDPATPMAEGVFQVADDLPVVVVDSRACGHTHVLRRFLLDSRADVMLLVPPDAPPAGFACSALARSALGEALEAGETIPEVAAALAAAAETSGLSVRTAEVGALALGVFHGQEDRQRMREAFAAVERAGGEERIRRRESVKHLDNPVAAHLMSPWTSHLAAWLSRRGVRPDAVTAASLVVGVAAAASAVAGTRLGYLGALLLAMLSFALDCTDGQLARYTVRYSPVGAWLDMFGDRVKEVLLLFGLALGGTRAMQGAGQIDHVDLTWWLAGLTAAVTLVRGLVALGFPRAFSLPSLPSPATYPTGLARVRFDLSKIAMLTFGERTLLLGVLAVVFGPLWAFVAMAALGSASGVALIAGRVRRARSLPPPDTSEALRVVETSDPVVALGLRPRAAGAFTPGPAVVAFGGTALLVALAWAVRLVLDSAVWAGVLLLLAALAWLLTGARHAATGLGGLAFLLPAGTAAAEFGVLLSAAWLAPDGSGMPFASPCVVLAVMLHRYDLEYTGSRLSGLGLGSDGRMLVVAAAAVSTAFALDTSVGAGVFLAACAAIVLLLMVRLVIVNVVAIRAAVRLRAERR